MCDADDLAFYSNYAEFLTDGLAHFATNVGVNLVEHQYRYLVVRSEYNFDSKHHARHLTARCNLPQWSHRLADVRRERKLNLVQSGG